MHKLFHLKKTIFIKITLVFCLASIIITHSLFFVVESVFNYVLMIISYRHTFSLDVRLVSNFGCKLHKFLVYWNGQTTALVLIVMTTGRFITISYPHQTKMSLTKREISLFASNVVILCRMFNFTLLVDIFTV